MFILVLLPQYFLWHYVHGFRAFLHVWRNLIWGSVHFFGLGNLSTSLFSPWKRVTEKNTKKWDFEAIAGAIVVNMMSRIIGFILRIILLVVGIVVTLLLIITGFLALIGWVFAPLVLFASFGYGIFLVLAGFYAYTV